MMTHLRFSHGGSSRGAAQAAPPNLITLLTLGLLCVNTLILLSDHQWLTDNRWLKQAVRTLEQAGDSSQASSAAAELVAQAATVGVIVGSSVRQAALNDQQQLSLAAADPALDLFQQARRCNTSPLMQQYRQLHSSIMSGEAPPRYLVSVAPETGMAERLTGLVTQFYMALLSGRALTAYHPDPAAVPPFSAACDYPLFNWTHQQPVPRAVYAPLLSEDYQTYAERRDAAAGLQAVPVPYDQEYQLFHMVNATAPMTAWLATTNLTAWPQDRPGLPHAVVGSNRGATWKLANNPYHSDDFWRLSLRPEEAFMCGFWALCKPNQEVRRLYSRNVWGPLADPHALKIGIQVRFGDEVLNTDAERADDPKYVTSLMSLATPFFECAAAIESAFSVPGQHVVWYLLSDSGELRRAAKDKFGDKLLTDTEDPAVHSSCRANTGKATRGKVLSDGACSPELTQRVMQHAVGSMLALSLADFHVMTKASQLGRVAASLSGKWNNMHELKLGDDSGCDPYTGAHPMMVSLHGAGI
jgi:hypothetical protein